MGFRKLCRPGSCPMADRSLSLSRSAILSRGEVSSLTPPGIFIGSYNYPAVYAGPMAVADPSSPYPGRNQYGKSKDELISLNGNVYRASRSIRVNDLDNPYTSAIQETAMSSGFMDMEMSISRILKGSIDRDASNESPVSSLVEIERLSMSSNPKIPGKVQYLNGDTDLRAEGAVWSLYREGFDVGYLQGVLSSGSLGLAKKRRLVPTRWSITAVDDILYRNMKEILLRNDTIPEIRVFRNSYLGNSFAVILLPHPFSFEMQELWSRGSMWGGSQGAAIDYEFTSGRKGYAGNVGGAYYAARLAVMEYMEKIGRQASAIVLRTIGSEYDTPMGVWVVRETVRHAMESPYTRYDTVDDLIRNENTGIGDWNLRSPVLRNTQVQKSIMDFF